MEKMFRVWPAKSEGEGRAGDRQGQDGDDRHRVLVGVELGGQDHVGDPDPQEHGEEEAAHRLPEGDARPAEDEAVADGQVRPSPR